MGRIRTIKPEYFRHELLQELEEEHSHLHPMLVFAGLWTISDKEGRFLWKPKQIKLDILPFMNFEMEETLDVLRRAGLIQCYAVGSTVYGVIPTFRDHQRINGKEHFNPARYPSPDEGVPWEAPGKHQGSNGEAPGKHRGKSGEGREKEKEKEKEKEPAFLRAVAL